MGFTPSRLKVLALQNCPKISFDINLIQIPPSPHYFLIILINRKKYFFDNDGDDNDNDNDVDFDLV